MSWLLLLFILVLANPTTEHEVLRTAFLQEINALRTDGCECGGDVMPRVGTLSWNDKLALSAELHARQMQRYHFFGHYSKGGKDVGERVKAVGYQWVTVGENIARGQRTVREVMDDWKASPVHCRVMMNPKVDEVGLARVGDCWVMHVGARNQ